jgi:4-amino-4-deoxy-L-arabinose transferase-like glycosyltransferase
VVSTSLRLGLLLALSLSLRLAAWHVIGNDRVPWEYEYEEIASNLTATGEYTYSFYHLTQARPTAFEPPVYPLFLAAVGKLAPGSSLINALQILLSCLTVLALYGLARALGGSTRQASLAAAFLAVYPPAVAYAATSSTVTLESFFIITATLLLIRAGDRGPWYMAAGAGLLFALAALTRSAWLVTLPLAFLWILLYRQDGVWNRTRLALPMLLGAAIVLAPWAAYTQRTQGKWMLTSTNGGLNFWIGNNPEATGEYIHPTELDRDLVLRVADWPERARDRFFYERGFDFVRSSPGQFLALVVRKLQYFFLFRPGIGSTYEQASLPLTLARWLFIISWLIVLPFSVYGLAASRQHWRSHLLLVAIFLSQAAIAAIFFVGTRFRTPVDGYALIWAAAGAEALAVKFSASGLPESPA